MTCKVAGRTLKDEDVQGIGGMVMGAVPIVSVVCAKSFGTTRPLGGFFVRKEAKGHGTNRLIDGNIHRGMRVILVDDVTTTGSSVLRAVRAARDSGCIVHKVISVVDRCQGAGQALEDEGVPLISIFSLADFDSSCASDSVKRNVAAG
ncbi:MAG: orotate phosphoribosyltransferase [Acetobacteraceae bacterium]